MQRYFLYFRYDGTGYHGWQIQPNARTVQEELQSCLSTIMRHDISVVGAGRTETGVHARMMVAHFDVDTVIDEAQIKYKLNRILPRDIAINEIRPVDAGMHARFSAVSRTYHYYVHLRKDPFLRAYSYEVPYKLDFAKMNEAANVLLEYEDFAAFCKSNSGAATTLCRVTEARWMEDQDCCWHFVITANRFLRNMVRAVVGTLVEVGRGRMDIDGFRAVIEGRCRMQAGESMPGNALFLEKIAY